MLRRLPAIQSISNEKRAVAYDSSYQTMILWGPTHLSAANPSFVRDHSSFRPLWIVRAKMEHRCVADALTNSCVSYAFTGGRHCFVISNSVADSIKRVVRSTFASIGRTMRSFWDGLILLVHTLSRLRIHSWRRLLVFTVQMSFGEVVCET